MRQANDTTDILVIGILVLAITEHELLLLEGLVGRDGVCRPSNSSRWVGL